tara:strand:+ start:10346 stop:11704 length:1359 start_codon:yes stop_codon:yes gene_type:complete
MNYPDYVKDMVSNPEVDNLNSEETEKQVIGCCLLEPELVDEAATSLKPEDFFELKNRNLFTLLLEMRHESKPIDVSVVIQEAKNLQGGTDAVGGIAYLAGLPDCVPSSAMLPYAVGVVKQKSRLRGYRNSAHEVLQLLSQGGVGDDVLLEEIATRLTPLLHHANRGGESEIKDVVRQAINEVEQAFSLKGECTGVQTGFLALDRLTSGFQKGDMVVLAARPSMGKTSLAMNIAEYASVDKGVPVGILSLEMGEVSLVKRMLSSRSNVDGHNLLTGHLTERDIVNLTQTAGVVAKAPIHINDSAALSVHEMSAACRRMVLKHGVKLLVIDYIQLLRAKAENRVQEVGRISSAIKASAKELGVPILALSQLSRSVETQDRPPRLSDLRDSGAIEQDADLVLFLSRGRGDTVTRLDLAKHRNGPTGIIELEWDAPRTRYTNPAYWNKEDAKVDTK